jgi:hypothetical protein
MYEKPDEVNALIEGYVLKSESESESEKQSESESGKQSGSE